MSPEAFNRLPPTRSLCWPHERIGHRVAAPAVRDRILMLTKRRMPANDVTIAVGDVCAGIGGFALGAPAHWRHAFFSEIDPFASAVLAQRFPDTPNLGDVGALAPADLPPLHVLCGGTPCQSFSSAGTQQGLSDPRGALTLKYLELVHGIQAKAPFHGTGVPVSIWENVVRVLQADEGSQFGTILAGLVGCDEPLRPADLYGPRWPHSGLVAGPKRIVAWSVFDAADYGLPQQRRRLFVVSVRNGDGLCPCQILAQARARAAHVGGSGSEQACAGTGSEKGAGSGGRVRVYQRNYARIGRGAPRSIARTVISQSGTSGRGDQAQLWLVDWPDGTVYTRRMMPVEHERLQGLPDDYTRIAYAGRDADACPDAPRYKAVGNSLAVPVVRAIAAAADAGLAEVINARAEVETARTDIANRRPRLPIAMVPANGNASALCHWNADVRLPNDPLVAHATQALVQQSVQTAQHSVQAAVPDAVPFGFLGRVDAVSFGLACWCEPRLGVPDLAGNEDRGSARVEDDVRLARRARHHTLLGEFNSSQQVVSRRSDVAGIALDRRHHARERVKRDRPGARSASCGWRSAIGVSRPPPKRVGTPQNGACKRTQHSGTPPRYAQRLRNLGSMHGARCLAHGARTD